MSTTLMSTTLMSRASIGTASIGTASISPASIGTASISPASISTASISTPAVGLPHGAQAPGLRAIERQSTDRRHLAAVPQPASALAAKVPASWQLTDRGIAVIMVIAAVIMTVALVVIGLTAMRVTSAGYDAGLQIAPQVQH
jgi:hypothetical protein